MGKKFYCAELVFGTSFEEQPFVLDAVGKIVGDRVSITLSDRSGSAKGSISKSLAKELELAEHIGEVFSISAAILSELRQPLIAV